MFGIWRILYNYIPYIIQHTYNSIHTIHIGSLNMFRFYTRAHDIHIATIFVFNNLSVKFTLKYNNICVIIYQLWYTLVLHTYTCIMYMHIQLVGWCRRVVTLRLTTLTKENSSDRKSAHIRCVTWGPGIGCTSENLAPIFLNLHEFWVGLLYNSPYRCASG